MVSPDYSSLTTHSSNSPNMAAKYTNGGRRGASAVISNGFLFVSGVMTGLLLVWAFFAFTSPDGDVTTAVLEQKPATTAFEQKPLIISPNCEDSGFKGFDMKYDPPEPTYFDDPTVGYTLDSRVQNWDEKRRDWFEKHPSFKPGSEDRVIILTGSQITPCKNPVGDHVLLRFFKNKVDYARIHGYDIFYNNVLFQPEMHTYWAKTPVAKAAMLAHPEAEWVWWVDSDAAFTDMDFKLPLEKYKDHNFVVHGWPDLIYNKKSWTSLNAGVFLMRNCQWSLDFMDVWASMGPQTPNYDKWGEILRATCKDKAMPESDDQTGLVYLLLEEKEKWGNKIYVESEYYFEGYWVEIAETLDNISSKYLEMEKGVPMLRRRHAEKVNEWYAMLKEQYLKGVWSGKGSWRRPFVTHFTGCQPCSGQHNQQYSGKSCWDAMQAVLNFADNQVLRNFGFVRPNLLDSASVVPLPFDYPN